MPQRRPQPVELELPQLLSGEALALVQQILRKRLSQAGRAGSGGRA
nr:hypothetical protein [Streptomyces sp. S1D4-11]